jgi:hypothetical protein
LELEDFDFSEDQLAELRGYPEELVKAWIKASTHPSVKSPAGFVLTGVRSGVMPFGQGGDESKRATAVRLAERWITNAGMFCPSPAEVESELFDGPASPLRYYREDGALRERMVTLWRLERPYGEQTEKEFLERAARNSRR